METPENTLLPSADADRLATDLPEDPAALRAMVLALTSHIGALEAQSGSLSARNAALETTNAELSTSKAALEREKAALEAANAKLRSIVCAMRDAAYGRKSEKLSEDQFQLALEELEAARTAVEKEAEAASPATREASQKRRRSVNRGSLPAHLERIEEILEPETTECACGCAMHKIGEDVTERLDVIPAQFRVIVTKRPKYACRACEEGVAQAPAASRIVEGGLPTEALIAHVLVSKFSDHRVPWKREGRG